MAEPDLQKRLERLGRTLVEDIETWESATREKRRKALDQLTETVGRKIEQALDRQTARQRRREEKRRREREEASFLTGAVFLLAAAGCAAFSVLRPDLWWLIFIALVTALSGARQLRLAGAHRRQLKREHRGADAVATRASHEVDVLCDGLLADLKSSPAAVRSFLQEPEKTVQSLRQTARALDSRRQQLLAEVSGAQMASIGAQRVALEKKRDTTQDPQARAKLDEALRSIDGQLTALHQLRVAAERVDGEYTSLLVLLQELRTRVAVAKTAGTSPQLEGLRQSVLRLNVELEAITEALGAVEHEGLPKVVSIASDEEEFTPGRDKDRV